jgi:phosphoserine aminotransferase
MPSEEITDEFIKTASKQNMVGLKGYRTVGGIRASLYNAMPVEGAQALSQFMKDFASKKS